MGYDKFKDFVFSREPEEMEFHFNKVGLVIVSKVISVEPDFKDTEINGITVHFNGGNLNVWRDNKITQVRRPSNLIIECEICFSLNNEYGDHIGFLYISKK